MGIFVGIGSNLGDRRAYLRRSVRLLEERGIRVTARSSIYETRPLQMDSDRPFLNACVEVETTLEPHELLDVLHEIEGELGRVRDGVVRDRTCDLDLLLYGDRRAVRPILPHPRICDRRFVLLPLLELAPDLRDPVTDARYDQAATDLADDPAQRCVRLEAPGGWSP